MQEEDWGDSGCLTYHNPQMTKIETITIPLQCLSRVSSVDDFSTQDTYWDQIYLLLHIIESRL
jgi:hypothetical protein